MQTLQKIILYPLCFYYVITPGSKRLGPNGSHFYEAFVLGIIQAFATPAIVYFFSDYARYWDLMASIGPWVGAWTFIGGMYYPILSQITEENAPKNKKKKEDKARIAQQKKNFKERLKNDPAWIKNRLFESLILHQTDQAHKIDISLFKDYQFVRKEAAKLGIKREVSMWDFVGVESDHEDK